LSQPDTRVIVPLLTPLSDRESAGVCHGSPLVSGLVKVMVPLLTKVAVVLPRLGPIEVPCVSGPPTWRVAPAST